MSKVGRMTNIVRNFWLAAALTSLSAVGATAQDTKPITMKLSTATVNDAQHEWMKRFAVAIDKNTNGRIKVEIFPGSQLGGSDAVLQAFHQPTSIILVIKPSAGVHKKL